MYNITVLKPRQFVLIHPDESLLLIGLIDLRTVTLCNLKCISNPAKRAVNMNLSICIITKNECNKLARLLASAEKLDCEIVVVDTGSSDDTMETAYRYTDRVFFYKWKNDFAEAKNHAAGLAGFDVVMILDTDEWITDFGERERRVLSDLVQKLEQDDYAKDHVGRINRINILEHDGERQENSEWINRIYNRRFFEYEGRIHEQLVKRSGDVGSDAENQMPADDAFVNSRSKEDYKLDLSSVKIYHDGYLGTPEEKHRKAERNRVLLLEELDTLEKNTEEKDNGSITKKAYVLYQLGKSCYMAGEPAAAAEYFDKALEFDLDPKLEFVIDMVETYGYALMNSGQEQKALGLEGVLDEFGGNADFCFMMGLVYMKNAQFDKALFCFDEALEKTQCRMEGVNSYLAQYNKGVIYECLGDRENARTCYKKAENYGKAAEGLQRLNTQANQKPILIIYGVTYCYNILNNILENLGKALERHGEQVEYYDEQAGGAAGLAKYIGREFKAVIGVQTYLYSIFLKDSGRYLFDGIKGPKFNIVLDHPGWLRQLLAEVPESTYVLTHDTNYIEFIKKYYPKTADSFLLPPGGMINPYLKNVESRQIMELKTGSADRAGTGSTPDWENRKYDLIFIGTYGDFRKKCEQIRECNPFAKKLALKYLIMLKKYLNDPAEKVFELTLKELGIEPSSNEEFLNLFAAMNPVVQLVMYYYREKTLRTLAEAGIDVDVWGETWQNAPFMKDSPYKEHIHVHGDLTPDEAEKILSESCIALNIMAWHKAGFTERLANTMLSGTVMLSDSSSYIRDHFKCLDPQTAISGDTALRIRESEFAVFDLNEMQILPQFVRTLLSDKAALFNMAQNGMERCKLEHTWDSRAEEFLNLCSQL